MRLNNTCINLELRRRELRTTVKSGLLYGQNCVVIIVQFALAAYRRSSKGIYLVRLTFYARDVLQEF